jgi:hypothetical protein
VHELADGQANVTTIEFVPQELKVHVITWRVKV